MSFGGLGGLAGSRYVQARSIHPAGHYVAVSQNGVPFVPPDAYPPGGPNDIFWRKSGPGATPPGVEDSNQSALQYISLAAFTNPLDEQETDFLDGCLGATTDDATDVDVGVLTTQAPSILTAGMHSLPANFGNPSRRQNQWRRGDEDYINVWFRLPKVCQVTTPSIVGPTSGTIYIPNVVRVTFIPNVAPLVLGDPRSAFGNIQIWIGNRGADPIPVGTSRDEETTSTPVMNVKFSHTIQR